MLQLLLQLRLRLQQLLQLLLRQLLRQLLLQRMGSDVVTEDQLYLGAMQGMLLAIEDAALAEAVDEARRAV